MNEAKLSDRIRMAHTIQIQSAVRRRLAISVSWYDVHGDSHTQDYSLDEGSVIEF